MRHRPAASWLLAAAAGLLAVGLAWIRWIDPATWNLVDLGVYVRGGRAVLSGIDPYTVSVRGLFFTYPPFSALLFVPLALLGGAAVGWVMTSASVASYLAVVRVSLTRATWPNSDSRLVSAWLAVLLVAGLALEPVQRTLIYGQVNLILAALVLVDLFVVPPRYRGLLIGLAAGIKLTPAAFVLLFLLRRDLASCVRTAAAGLATVAAAWAVLPAASWRYWSGGFAGMDKFGYYAVQPANQSVRACLVRFFGGDAPALAYALSALAVAALTVCAARRMLRAGDDLAAVTVVAVGGLLASPVSWAHHWVWVVPALVVMARRGWRIAVALTVLAMFLPPAWAVSGDPLHLGFVNQLLASSYVIMGVAYLIAMSVTRPPARGATPHTAFGSARELQHLGHG